LSLQRFIGFIPNLYFPQQQSLDAAMTSSAPGPDRLA